MNFDCGTSDPLLAPIDWEFQTQHPIVDDDIIIDQSSNCDDKEEYERRLMWPNSDILWKVPENPDIMLEIFSRLPPKSLLRFNCLSKKVHEFIKQHCFLLKQFDNTRDAVTGFFGQKSRSQDEFVYPDDFEGIQYINLKSKHYSLHDPVLNFLMPEDSGYYMVRLLDSCNGILLCISIKTNPSAASPKRKENAKSDKICFVCNPFTMEKVALPHYHRRSTRVNHALMADLDGKGYLKYKVVCLLREKLHDSGTELLIFSSETGEWEEKKADFPSMHHPTMMGSKVFFNGSLFWDCFETHILVCHFDNKRSSRCYELIEAPRASIGRCLWKFNEKLLCYCHHYKGDFPAWSLSINEFSVFEWKSEGCEMFEIMSRDITRMNCENLLIGPKVRNSPQVRFKIIAHDPVLNIVYVCLNDMMFSYGLCNREVSLMRGFDNYSGFCNRNTHWRWKFESKTCVVAYRHTLARIQMPKNKKEKEGGKEKDENNMENRKLLESDVDKDNELLLVYENCAEKVKPRRRKGKKVKYKEKGTEKDEEEYIEIAESTSKYNDEFGSSLSEDDSSNEFGPKHEFAKRINFSLLHLDDE